MKDGSGTATQKQDRAHDLARAQDFACPNCEQALDGIHFAQEGNAVYCIPCWKDEQQQRYGIRFK